MQSPSNLNDRLIACFFLTIEMALQLGINISFAKNIDQPLGNSLCCLYVLRVSVVNCLCKWTILPTSQTNQSRGMCRQFLWRYRTLSRLCMFKHAQFHQSD